ncbi:thymidylate kinase [Calothrix sp. NIES-2100]|uniref:deoxynucleoside kinase n=1 Tax=Calothrix sp. NIES-2100 TaxID=1954172 RepID=UPI000B5E4147|nr:thymidylate kinase [Calothrix sp. NIES-2100]
MIDLLKTSFQKQEANQKPLIVEFLGPAGAGKTTLLRALKQSHPNIKEGVIANEIDCIPYLITNTLLFFPTFISQYQHTRWFTWKETRSMIYTQVWHEILEREKDNKNLAILFDHGPLFRLARLLACGPDITKSPIYQEWSNKILAQWMNTLDIVVWLDAPNTVLLQRVHNRDTWHEVKEKSDIEGHNFLENYRRVYEEIITQIKSNSPIKILHFNTSEKSVEHIANETLMALI